MGKSFKVYAIVVCFNGSKWIEKCLKSLISSTIPLTIIAVDNASTDGTPDIIREYFPMVQVIEAGENLGFGKANNIGLNMVLEAKADFAFLLNQDAWINTNTLERLLTTFNKNPGYGILSPIHLNAKGDELDFNFSQYLCPITTPSYYSDLFFGRLSDIYETKYVNAASWFVSYNCLRTVGVFNPLFKHYGEDDEYLSRVFKANLKVGIVSKATIYHDRTEGAGNSEIKIKNKIYTTALLEMLKTDTLPKKFLLIRRIISLYFTSYFVYRGKNTSIRKEIEKEFVKLRVYNDLKENY